MTRKNPKPISSRREFMARGAALLGAAAAFVAPTGIRRVDAAAALRGPAEPQIRFGLVTYQWGRDMDLPSLIAACEKTGLAGVELRTQHLHSVEPAMSALQRTEVRKRFEDSPVELVGYGSNAQFHDNDESAVRENIELTKRYIQLMHDCGGSGVKVKPNGFVDGVPREKTIAQIGRALNVVGAYGQQYGQQIRVEAHGAGTSELPVMKAIFDIADHPNVAVCWNSNKVDLEGAGLARNFELVKQRLGATTHVRELTLGDYPYDQLFSLLVKSGYRGWVLLEAHDDPPDRLAALMAQRMEFERLMSSIEV